MENDTIPRVKAYVQLAREVWDTFGLATLLVCTALAAWFGWINSPFSEAKTIMQEHVGTTTIHTSHDPEIIFYLKTLCQTNAKLANTDVRLCNWDPR